MDRQYIGARYVPKFFEGENGSSEWVSGISYEALTIVTHLGNSFTSKKPVPDGIDILNKEYWVVTGNYNEQVEGYRKETEKLNESLTYYLREKPNSNITELLSEKLKTGNVVLDGKTYTIDNIIIPNYKRLYGNNSTLIVNNNTEVAIIVGNELHSGYSEEFAPTGISDLTLQCNNKCNGVLVKGQGDILNNVTVLSPITYGFKIGDNTDKSTDVNINNCRVNGVCDYGFISNGLDNFFNECRTLFCKKASFQNNGGGNYYTLCHGLGITSDISGYENSSSFELNNSAFLTDCYCDNSRYGVYAPNYSGVLSINGLYCNWYEHNNETISRYGIIINGGCNATINNVVCDNTHKSITRLKINNFLQWAPLSNFSIAFDVLPGTRYNSNDISFLAEFNRNNKNYMAGKTDGYNAICGYKNFYGVNQSNSSCFFNIYGDCFTLLGANVRTTNTDESDPQAFYTVNKGVFTADSNPNARIEIALLKKDNDLFIAYKLTNITYNANVVVECGGANSLYIPRDGVNLDGATKIDSYSLSL